jgi:hypothetical protein
MLGRLWNAGITLVEVVGQYHARGVVPLRRRPLRLCDMTTDRAPWVGTVTAPELPSPLEVQCHVAQAIGRTAYAWPPSRMLPMLPNAGTEKFVSCPSSRQVSFALCHGMTFSGSILVGPCHCSWSLSLQSKCAHLVPAKVPLPEEAIFNHNQAAAEKKHAVRKAQHKKCQIAKRDSNDNRTKRQKAGERGVSSDEDPSPEPSWSGDVASAAVDWSNMSGSSSSSYPAAPKCRRRAGRGRRGTTRLWARAHVRRLPPPEWTSSRSVPMWCPAERALPSRRDLAP